MLLRSVCPGQGALIPLPWPFRLPAERRRAAFTIVADFLPSSQAREKNADCDANRCDVREKKIMAIRIIADWTLGLRGKSVCIPTLARLWRILRAIPGLVAVLLRPGGKGFDPHAATGTVSAESRHGLWARYRNTVVHNNLWRVSDGGGVEMHMLRGNVLHGST